MRAMILSAGRGNRLRPLSDVIPKPLMTINGKPLIEYHLQKCVAAGIQEIIINVSHLGENIEKTLGNGARFDAMIEYSYEDPVLETGGGIVKMLSRLGPEPFAVISADIFTDFPFERLKILPEKLAHLILVDNPPHHPTGDFAILEDKSLSESGRPLFNYAGIGVYRPELFIDCPKDRPFPLGRVFKAGISNREITGEYYSGIWYNIGTKEQLEEVDNAMSERQFSESK